MKKFLTAYSAMEQIILCNYSVTDAANVKFQLRGRSLIVYSPTSFTGNDHSIVAPDKKLQLEWVYPFHVQKP